MGHQIPDGFLFTPKHEWVKEEGDLLAIGISSYAQDALGDIVFLDVPDAGAQLRAGESFGNIESVKAVEDLYAPVSGTIVETNAAARQNPETINKDPYGTWLVKINSYDRAALGQLMNAVAYTDFLSTLGE